jgi:hypothetical protein
MIPFDYDQADWGSRRSYPDGQLNPWVPDKMVVHWGGGPNHGGVVGAGVAAEKSVLRSWQRYHIDTKGWYDIAYNYAVGNTGSIYRLRGENRAGATSGDYENDGIPENHEARAVVWIGGLGQVATPEAIDSMSRIRVAGGHEVTIGHRDVKGVTTCPGEFWLEWARSQEGESVEAVVKALQAQCNAGGFTDDNGDPLDEDGKLGPKTQQALNALSIAAASDDHDHPHKHRFTGWTKPGLTVLGID